MRAIQVPCAFILPSYFLPICQQAHWSPTVALWFFLVVNSCPGSDLPNEKPHANLAQRVPRQSLTSGREDQQLKAKHAQTGKAIDSELSSLHGFLGMFGL